MRLGGFWSGWVQGGATPGNPRGCVRWAVIDSCNLREARKASNMTQVEPVEARGVSRNRISRMENEDVGSMSVDVLRRYVEALGGHMTLVTDLPNGGVSIV